MNIELESILWHEIGHLIIDIAMVSKHSDISIKEIVIRNYECENVKWCGWVQLEPEYLLTYEEVISDIPLMALKFLSLYNGCLFQSLFSPDKIKVNDCFNFSKKAIGKSDSDQSSELMSQFLKKHAELRGNMDFFNCHNDIIINELKAMFLGIANLKGKLIPIIENEVVKIQADILANINVKRYHYTYCNEELDELIKSINKVMTNCNLHLLINGLVLKMIDNLEKHIK